MCVCVIAWVGGGGVGVQGDMIDWKAAAKNRQTEVNALNEMNHYWHESVIAWLILLQIYAIY